MREVIRTVNRFVEMCFYARYYRPFGVDTSSLSFDVSGENDPCGVLQERREVDALDMYRRIVDLIVDIVTRPQVRFATLIFRVTGYLYTHRREVHLGRIEVGFRADIIRTNMQTVRSDQVVVQ